MSKFEWSFIKDYALDNKTSVEQIINKARKGELRLCAIMDETNYPGGYKSYQLHGFRFEDYDLNGFIFRDNESTLSHNDYDYNPEDLILYAEHDNVFFLKLDKLSLIELLKKERCVTPTVHRSTYVDLKSKMDSRTYSIESDLDTVVVITKDELQEDDRSSTRERNSLIKIIGSLAEIAGDKLGIDKGFHSENGPGATVVAYLYDQGIDDLKKQTAAKKIQEGLKWIEENKTNKIK